MVESVKDVAIFTVDPQGRVASWNPGAEQLFGYAEPEILGRGIAVIFTPEDRDAGVPERELATAAARGAASDERWHLRKDGSRFFASGVMSPIYDEDDRLCGFTKVARDITERNRAEEAVREAAVRLKAIVDTAVDGIITMDEGGIIESMNPAAERIFGHAHEEVVGRGIAMLMPEPYLTEHDGYLESYLRSGEPKIIGTIREVHGRRKDGSVFPMELAVSESRLGDAADLHRHRPRHHRVQARRRGAHPAARRARGRAALLNTLLDNAPVGFGFFDHELRYFRLNPALAGLNGLPVEAHLGRTMPEVLPRMSPEVFDAFRRVLRTGTSIVNKEFRGETPRTPGRPRYWLCSFYPVKTPDGAVLGAGAVVTDIDDRKRMEEALKEADQRKDQFLAMLAHELRNPLAPISNAVQIMKVQGLNGPNFQWSVKVIEDQVKHMTRMVDDLLDVSRITRGKVVLQKEPVELEAVVDLAVEASRPLIEDCHHHLTIALPEHPVLLEVDPARMAQVLSNLLNNAAKYTDEGGEIALSAEQQGREVVIRVRDNGTGIAPELLPHIFDMFTQADQTLSRSRGGLGIGLTLVRSLVEMHDGRVTARSEGPGRGSEFAVRLPGPGSDAPAARERRGVRRRRACPAAAPPHPRGRRQPLQRHQPGRPAPRARAGRRDGLRRPGRPRAGAPAPARPRPARHRPARHGRLRGRPPLPRGRGPAADHARGHDRLRQGRGPPPLSGGRLQRPPGQARQPRGPPGAPHPARSDDAGPLTVRAGRARPRWPGGRTAPIGPAVKPAGGTGKKTVTTGRVRRDSRTSGVPSSTPASSSRFYIWFTGSERRVFERLLHSAWEASQVPA